MAAILDFTFRPIKREPMIRFKQFFQRSVCFVIVFNMSTSIRMLKCLNSSSDMHSVIFSRACKALLRWPHLYPVEELLVDGFSAAGNSQTSLFNSFLFFLFLHSLLVYGVGQIPIMHSRPSQSHCWHFHIDHLWKKKKVQIIFVLNYAI